MRFILSAPFYIWFGLGALSCLSPISVHADDLNQALVQAYVRNPQLKAAVESLKATDEQAGQAFSGWLPSLSFNYQAGNETNKTGTTAAKDYSTSTKQVNFSQPLFRGGRTMAEMDRAQYQSQAGRASLSNTEQNVLFDAITAYMDVLRDEEILRLNHENEQVLYRSRESTSQRFEAKEVTKTDLAQAEARLSGASAARISAQGELEQSRAAYVRIIGDVPHGLFMPPVPFGLPNSLQDAIAIAQQNNPSILQSQFEQKSATKDISINRSPLFPQVSFNSTFSNEEGATYLGGNSVDSQRYYVNVTVPLYQAGTDYSRIRQAKQTALSRNYALQDTQNRVREAVISAWESYSVSRASIQSNIDAVKAATIAVDGVKQEMLAGTRNLIDVLDQEQELFSAKVRLVRSQHEAVTTAFNLKRMMGSLTAQGLGLPVQVYDPQINYDKARIHIF